MKGSYLAIGCLLAICSVHSSIGIIFLSTYVLFIFLRKKVLLFPVIFVIGFSFVYFSFIELQNKTQLSPIKSTYVTITNPIRIDGDSLTTIGKINKESVAIRYKLHSEREKEHSRLQIGMTCFVNGELKKPSEGTNPYSFDYENYLRTKKIYWQLVISKIETCQQHSSLLNGLQNYRESLLHYTESHFPKEIVGIVQALLFGEQSQMDEFVLDSYSQLGLVHLLAISGLHVTLLISMVYYTGLRVGVTRERMVIALLIILPIYGVLAGASPPVMRSILMAELFLLLSKFKRKITGLDMIGYVFLLMELYNPYNVFNVGFQLSFLVSASIIISARFLSSLSSIKQLFWVSFIAQMASLPIILYYFYEFSSISLFLNMVFVPLYSFILPLAFVTLLFVPIPVIGQVCMYVLNTIITLANTFVAFDFSAFMILTGHISLLFIAILSMLLLTLMVVMERRNYRQFFLVFGVFVLVISGKIFAPYMNKYGEVTVLDVGQGDCIIIEFPYRKAVYMIDTGGTLPERKALWQQKKNAFDLGKDTVVPYLKAKGIRHITKLFVTHGDYDHMGAAISVMENMPVDEVVFGISKKRNDLEQKVYEKIKALQIKWSITKQGDIFKDGGIPLTVLSPDGTEGDETNSHSIVLYGVIGGKRWLFTGDLGMDGEKKLLERFNLQVDVLKVGHHGSKTSTSEKFLEEIKPSIAIISVGRNNRYGHPTAEVLKRLEHTTIYRTDLNGAIRYKFDAQGGTFTSILP